MLLYPFGNKYFFVLLETAAYLSLLWDVLGIGTAIVGCCELDYNNQQVCLLIGAVGASRELPGHGSESPWWQGPSQEKHVAWTYEKM